jgi:hypothetical protein
MASQVSPGIVIKERDLSNAVITGAQQITAAFASTFQKGPIDQIININSQKQLIDIFGKPSDANAEDWYVASEFLNYGGRLAVVRAATNVSNASTDGGYLVKSDEDWISGGFISEDFIARTAGIWGNSLLVAVVDRGADQYVTLAEDPANVTEGTLLTFTGGKTAEVISWDSQANVATVLLTNGSDLITTGDTLDTPDTGVIATVNSVSEVNTDRTPGTYNGVATTGGAGAGATVNVTIANAGGPVLTVDQISAVDVLRTPGTYTGVATTGGSGSGLTVTVTIADDGGGNGGAVSVDVVNGGTGYVAQNTITVAAALIGTTGPDVTFQVATATITGGAVSVTPVNGGLGYVAGNTLTVAAALIGGAGPDVTFDIASVNNTSIAVTAVADWYSNTEITYGMGQTTGIKLSAIGPRPGTSDYASSNGIEWDEVHVVVIDLTGAISGSANNIVERFTYLSKLGDGRSTESANTYYRTVINEQSNYIFTGSHPSTQYNVGAGYSYYPWGLEVADLESGDKFNLALLSSSMLYGGEDDYNYNSAEVGNAYDLFLDTEETIVDFVLMGGSMPLESDTKAKASKVISIAATRKDCIAFVSPHKGNQVGSNGALTTSQQKVNTINFFNGLTSTSYAVFDSGYKYFYDRFNDKYRYIPCNGDIAGLCVATSSALDDWYSPAGVNRGSLRNAVKLAYNPNKADRDELYQARINPIVSFPGSGVTLFGDKTALASPSAFDRINVRRLFLNVQKRAEGLAKQVLFDQNDETTRASFASALNSYMSEVQARRGVTDFLVVCDESNNTTDVIDRYEFVAEVYIKPTRSINYITVTLTATKTGVSFAEVVGR